MRWSLEEMDILRRVYPAGDVLELARNLRRTVKAVKGRAKVLGVRRAKGHRPYTKKEDRQLRKLFPNRTSADVAQILGITRSRVDRRAHLLGLKKTPEHHAKLLRLEGERLRIVGVSRRFQPGQIPPNKGLRRPGYSVGRGRMQSTQFKKGERYGAANSNWKPVGTVTFNADGYLIRKVADEPNAGVGAHSKNWELVHKRVWRDAHGPIPKGHRIWWKDGNHANCKLENLELLSDKEHMARTTIHKLPAELKEVVMLAGRLKRRIGTVERGKARHQGTTETSV